MDLELIKKLVKLIDTSGITDFSVEDGETKIKISKRISVAGHVLTQPVIHAPAAAMPQQISATKSEAPAAEKTAEAVPSNMHEIRSPIVGTFYRAPSPDADPFVKIGDSVTTGKVLCIIEAMKLMNEIESDVSGKIVKVLVENGKPVEYNQPLFLIEV
ncbi:MAG TPA: acetyl-CoA carboxylase biotin carboxyl carrier protein [Ignavibacteriales bacterium]|nr:acetyl-CoA carboxylase biotin carboxyl carrier protein [Ignavibacteriales bacterium]